MQPKFITVEGISLAYFEKNQDAEDIIFFIHGNSSSSQIWSQQWESVLLSPYRLIALDMPAHGQSSCSPDYSLPTLGRIVAAGIDQLVGERNYIIAGLSLGTNVLAESLAYSLRPQGIILIGSCVLGGACTMESMLQPGVDMHAAFTDEVSEEELLQYWALTGRSPEDENYLLFSKDYYATQDNFRSKMFATVMAGNISDEAGLLQQSGLPVLVIFGKEEKVCNIDYLDNAGIRLWQDTVFKIPGAGHFANIDQPEKLDGLIAEYAKELFK